MCISYVEYKITSNNWILSFYTKATCPELSPKYAGTLNGLANGSGNTMGFISPLIVAALVEGNVRLIYFITLLLCSMI